MSLVSLVFGLPNGGTSIGAMELDALLTERESLNSRATRYYVEQGAPITDHIRQESPQLSISGTVSSASVRIFGAAGRERLVQAKDALRKIYREQLPVTIVTGLDVYTDMAMERCEINRSADRGNALDIDCEFVKIRTATLNRAELPPINVAADVLGKAGDTQNAGKAATSSPEATVGDKAINKVRNALGLDSSGSILSSAFGG